MCTILPKLFDLNQIGWNREKCILSVFCWLFVSNNCCWFGLFCCCCCLWSFLHFVALFCWPPSSERFLIVHLEGKKMIKYLMKKLFFFLVCLWLLSSIHASWEIILKLTIIMMSNWILFVTAYLSSKDVVSLLYLGRFDIIWKIIIIEIENYDFFLTYLLTDSYFNFEWPSYLIAYA